MLGAPIASTPNQSSLRLRPASGPDDLRNPVGPPFTEAAVETVGDGEGAATHQVFPQPGRVRPRLISFSPGGNEQQGVAQCYLTRHRFVSGKGGER